MAGATSAAVMVSAANEVSAIKDGSAILTDIARLGRSAATVLVIETPLSCVCANIVDISGFDWLKTPDSLKKLALSFSISIEPGGPVADGAPSFVTIATK